MLLVNVPLYFSTIGDDLFKCFLATEGGDLSDGILVLSTNVPMYSTIVGEFCKGILAVIIIVYITLKAVIVVKVFWH